MTLGCRLLVATGTGPSFPKRLHVYDGITAEYCNVQGRSRRRTGAAATVALSEEAADIDPAVKTQAVLENEKKHIYIRSYTDTHMNESEAE